MEIELTSRAKEDLEHWKASKNDKVLKRIRELIEAIQHNPFTGIGKPEPLKYKLSGKWSRRITKGDRLIYAISNSTLYIYSLKGHYE